MPSDLASRGSCHSQLLLGLDVKCADCQNIKHLPTVIDLLSTVVQVSESLPEGLALKLSLLKSADNLTVSTCLRVSWCTGATVRLYLLD